MTVKPVILSLLFTFPVIFSRSQFRWRNVDSAYGPLPASLHVYRSPDSLGGLPFIAWYVSARLKDRRLLFAAQTEIGRAHV